MPANLLNYNYMKSKKTILRQLCLWSILLPFFAVSIQSCKNYTSNNAVPPQSGFGLQYEIRIDSIINVLTIEEKIYMIHGCGMFVSGGVERLGIPELRYTDGPTGIREEMERNSWKPLNLTTDSVTFFPTGTALAATWNEELALRYGKAIGSEANARGKDILLGPGVNIIRTPLCGRNFEYFTEDPYLNSRMAVGYIEGVQSQDVAACVKHYTANNQEYERGLINVMVDERTLREIYLPVYKAAVQEAGVYTFMGAYNKVRGDWMCENDYLLNKVLKDEWDFKGFVMSDWGGTHTAVKAALAGLDVEMGGYLDSHHFASLADSVKAGLVPESVINDKVRRILRVMFNCKTTKSTRKQGKANTPENSRLAYDVASEAIVLLKNRDKLLPLNINNIKSIAVIGENAVHPQSRGGFTASVKARYEVSPLEGIKKKAGDRLTVNFVQGYKENFVLADTGGRWPYRYPDPTVDQTLLDEAVKAVKASDVAVIFAGTSRNVETEAVDRETLQLPFGQDELIKAVAAANPKTIVVVVAGAACNLNVTDQCVSTILYSWFNGSEAGNAIADVLFGDMNPSGKLPFTIPVKLGDVGAHALKAYPGHNFTVEYKEGILVGYRWFDTKNIEPKYPFGYGLSYTTFDYKNLKTNKTSYKPGQVITLTADISNTGPVSGKETMEVYIQALESTVPRALKELKAFKKIELKKDEQKQIQLNIKVDDLAYYNAGEKQWIVEPGKYRILVGSSSRDIRLESDISVK
jgi:beta-glucosidase